MQIMKKMYNLTNFQHTILRRRNCMKENAPNMLTGKDLDYLQDIFNWNYYAFKNCSLSLTKVKNNEIKKHFRKCNNFFKTSLNKTLTIIKDGKACE